MDEIRAMYTILGCMRDETENTPMDISTGLSDYIRIQTHHKQMAASTGTFR
jgi:hypothetical protein